MIDERQVKAIELLIAGEHTKTNIAKIVGVSRTTLYSWMDDVEFMENLNKRLQQIQTIVEKELNAKLPEAISRYWELANTTTDPRVKEKCYSYWIDRVMGKTTSKLDIGIEAKQMVANQDDILADIQELDDNAIELDAADIEETE